MRETTSLGETKRLSDSTTVVGLLMILSLIGLIALAIGLLSSGNSSNSESLQSSQPAEQDTFEQAAESSTVTQPSIVEETSHPEEATSAGTQPVETQEQVTSSPVSQYVEASSDEIYALACLIWLEGRGQPIACQEAIASVVINRYTTEPERYHSLFDVMYAPGQFSPSDRISSTKPTQVQIDIATKIVREGPTIPEYVTYFRANYYHNWGDQVPYCSIGTEYFSYSARLRARVDNTEATK